MVIVDKRLTTVKNQLGETKNNIDCLSQSQNDSGSAVIKKVEILEGLVSSLNKR